MAKYGNILTIFNGNLEKYSQVDSILDSNQVTYHRIQNVYFIETNSKNNTKDVMNNLHQLESEFELKYVIVHLQISDGSIIKTKNMSEKDVDLINKILK